MLRKAGLLEYSDEVVNRPDIQDVIRKTDYTVFSDEEAEAKGYHLWTTFLDVTLKDGRTISARVDAAKGSADSITATGHATASPAACCIPRRRHARSPATNAVSTRCRA